MNLPNHFLLDGCSDGLYIFASQAMLHCTSLVHAKLLQSCPTLFNLMDCSPPGSSVHGDSPGKNTGVGCHALLQGIFPTQELSPDPCTVGGFSSVQFSSVQSLSCVRLFGTLGRHARPPCPSPTPRVHSDSCASSR